MPLQGAYAAKRCPVRAQNDVLHPAEPQPPDAVLRRRFQLGREFEENVLSLGLGAREDVVAIKKLEATAGRRLRQARWQTAPLILGGRLPADLVGRRVGEPDVLVASSSGGYRAVDVKHHRCLDIAIDAGTKAAQCSTFENPFFERVAVDECHEIRWRQDDLLQLAHYQRMLEATGHAASDGNTVRLSGPRSASFGYDLDLPVWKTSSTSARRKTRTSMEIYDFEFDFRLDVIAVAREHAADTNVPCLVVPGYASASATRAPGSRTAQDCSRPDRETSVSSRTSAGA